MGKIVSKFMMIGYNKVTINMFSNNSIIPLKSNIYERDNNLIYIQDDKCFEIKDILLVLSSVIIVSEDRIFVCETNMKKAEVKTRNILKYEGSDIVNYVETICRRYRDVLKAIGRKNFILSLEDKVIDKARYVTMNKLNNGILLNSRCNGIETYMLYRGRIYTVHTKLENRVYILRSVDNDKYCVYNIKEKKIVYRSPNEIRVIMVNTNNKTLGTVIIEINTERGKERAKIISKDGKTILWLRHRITMEELKDHYLYNDSLVLEKDTMILYHLDYNSDMTIVSTGIDDKAKKSIEEQIELLQ